MDIRDIIRDKTLLFDGGTGTLLVAAGLGAGERPEAWNLSHPDIIRDLHAAYFGAGSNIVCTNTFGANGLFWNDAELEKIVTAAVALAKEARDAQKNPDGKFVALDIGPLGRLLAPLGDLDFEEAVGLFKKTVSIGAEAGADLVFIETMTDSYETKAALLAAKEACDLPVFVSNAYGEDGKLLTGATPEAMVALLEGMGADAVGANCSVGPDLLAPVVERLLASASVPVIVKPNAGLPAEEGGRTVYRVGAEEFARMTAEFVREGARAVGGCCGTTPDHIAALARAVENIPCKKLKKKNDTLVSSYAAAVRFGDTPVLIGERINPTGKPRLKEAILTGNTAYLLEEGVRQEAAGAQILDVNVGVPGIDEPQVLTETVTALQTVTSLPLQIDTSDPRAMERALRRYNGKPLINSVTGKRESMDAVFPLQKKYGGVAVALTLDENGIPKTAEGRLAIAKKILARAKKYGIEKKNLIFDPLTMTVATDPEAARVTLDAVRLIGEELGCRTTLGVSNVSYGLPARGDINGTFFALAIAEGLSAAIVNPHSEELMRAYRTANLLLGHDPACAEYIRFAGDREQATAPAKEEITLRRAIERGMKDKAAELCAKRISDTPPMEIVNGEIIPALDFVGAEYDAKRYFLPQLLMSAEAAQAAFAVIRERASVKAEPKCPFVIATVEGDIHDIGKNIVRLLLENYGFRVIDLGRDVKCADIVRAVREHHAPLCGLSALMTTTVPAMERTLKALRESAPDCRVVVGGAVLTQDYADKIGADHYARDAMDTVRYALGVYENIR